MIHEPPICLICLLKCLRARARSALRFAAKREPHTRKHTSIVLRTRQPAPPLTTPWWCAYLLGQHMRFISKTLHSHHRASVYINHTVILCAPYRVMHKHTSLTRWWWCGLRARLMKCPYWLCSVDAHAYIVVHSYTALLNQQNVYAIQNIPISERTRWSTRDLLSALHHNHDADRCRLEEEIWCRGAYVRDLWGRMLFELLTHIRTIYIRQPRVYATCVCANLCGKHVSEISVTD